MTLQDTLLLRYFRHVVATPQGRAHVLNQVADAESNGESAVFENMLSLADDPVVAKVVKRHADDEVRHAGLFHDRVRATGIDPGPAPAHLRLIERVDQKLGGFLHKPVRERRDMMEAYLILQVIEERALTLFPVFVEGFRDVDPETADVFVAVGKDEERHLKYCRAVARRYAPSPAIHAETLREFRRLEGECFVENGRANMDYNFEHGNTDLNAAGRLMWRGLALLGKAIGDERKTPFWEDQPAVA
jgi:uncharacterized ferritin-like protein (DUF455 family)